jgi:uncharacterized alkaline shock family protein YloU
MYKIAKNDLGEIVVNKEVIETIAGLAALDCYGLVGMVAKNIQEGLVNVLGRDSVRKGVQVTTAEDGIIVDLFCVIGYGVKISEVAANIMQNVTYALRQSAGIPVMAVHVNVRGIKVLQEV